LASVYQHGTTDNGICGAKLMYFQFAELATKLATLTKYRQLPLADSLSILFPRLQWIWLRRRDTARQAISYYRASQTDVWWRIDGEQNPKRPGTTDDATFDPLAIARLEQELVLNDLNWQVYFNDSGIAPLTLYYEDLAADYPGILVHVLKWLGIPDADIVPVAPPRLEKQADSQTEKWLSRYIAEGPAEQPSHSPSTTSRPAPPPASRNAPSGGERAALGRVRSVDAVDRLQISIFQVAGDDMFKGHRADGTGWDWSGASPQRDWMSAAQGKLDCLPLTLANQAGWWVYNPVGFTAVWHGGSEIDDVEFQFDCEPSLWSTYISGRLRCGIITWNTPFLFRTKPAGSRLLVCGPANYFKHAIQPLTAIVESDSMAAPLTMSWKITAPHSPVRFDRGEPILQVIPLATNACDPASATIAYMRLAEDPVTAHEYSRWIESRRGAHEETVG